MKRHHAAFPLGAVLMVSSLIGGSAWGSDPPTRDGVTVLAVATHDGLALPARVTGEALDGKKMLLFIGGSTPYDEKGSQGTITNSRNEMIPERNDFYARFLEIMPRKGYSVAMAAKRSYVYPTRIPRPNFSDLTLDVQYFIEELKNAGLLKNEKDLVLVGYSEGSVVAAKVLANLRTQPGACVLLGPVAPELSCANPSVEGFYMTDVLRRLKGWNDAQIRAELEKICRIREALLGMDEEEFEKEYKRSRPLGFGFAPWESFYIDRETFVPYDLVPHLVLANIPTLLCVGEDDATTPMVSAKRLAERLSSSGLHKLTLRTIPGESHGFKDYNVFAIVDAWLSSGFRSTDFVLDESDREWIEEHARVTALIDEIRALPFEGADREKALGCYRKAVAGRLADSMSWFDLGLKLLGQGDNDEAAAAFARATDDAFVLRFASLVWMGHLRDLNDEREEAVALYRRALEAYPGFPMQHDNWGIVIDKAWIEDRIRVPFKGAKSLDPDLRVAEPGTP